jgi:hypothetical protein
VRCFRLAWWEASNNKPRETGPCWRGKESVRA